MWKYNKAYMNQKEYGGMSLKEKIIWASWAVSILIMEIISMKEGLL